MNSFAMLPGSRPAERMLAAAALLWALAACQQASPPPSPAGASSHPADAPLAAASQSAPDAGEHGQPEQDQPEHDQPEQDVPPATAPTAAAAVAAANAQARFDGYGDLRFGMDPTQARRAWGGELKGEAAADGGCHYLRPVWVESVRQFGFMFEGGRLVRVDVALDSEAAPGGGRRGMSAARIAELYPGLEEQPHKYQQGAHYLRVRDPGGSPAALVFETDADGRVASWRIGLPPQVDYVEGCG